MVKNPLRFPHQVGQCSHAEQLRRPVAYLSNTSAKLFPGTWERTEGSRGKANSKATEGKAADSVTPRACLNHSIHDVYQQQLGW